MKTKIVLAMVAGAVSLGACSKKTDPTEKNFGAALTQYFAKKGDLCLDTKKWPVDIPGCNFFEHNEAKMAALESTQKQNDLCWGKMALDHIVKWEGPMKFGDYQEANITYTYKIDNLADWAKRPDVQAAFTGIKSTLDGAGKRESRHAVKLTSQGWEAKGLD